MSERGSEANRNIYEDELKHWVVQRGYSSSERKKERFKEIISASSRALQEPRDVCSYLEQRYYTWVRAQEQRNIYYPRFEEYDTEDRAFLSKNHPLINLALARFSTSAFVLETLFQTGNEAIRCAALSHWAPLEWLRNHSRTLRENEIEALLTNPHLEAQPYLEFCLEKGGPFSSLPELKWIKCIIIASSNACFSEDGREQYRGGQDEGFAGYYSYLNLVELLWGLADHVPVTLDWARCLSLSLSTCVLPNKPRSDLLELISRWETPSEYSNKYSLEERHVFERVRINLARRIAFGTELFEKLKDNDDIALRTSYYLRFKPKSVAELEPLLTKDGKIFIRAAVENEDLVENDELTAKLLEYASGSDGEEEALVEQKIREVEEAHVRRLLTNEQSGVTGLDESASQLLQCIQVMREIFDKPQEGSCHFYGLFLDLAERLEANAQLTDEDPHEFSQKLTYLKGFLESLYYSLSKEARALRDFQSLMSPLLDDASQRLLWERSNAKVGYLEGWTSKAFREVDMSTLVPLVGEYLERKWLSHPILDAMLLDALLANHTLQSGERFKKRLGSKDLAKAEDLYNQVDGNLVELVRLIKKKRLTSFGALALYVAIALFAGAGFGELLSINLAVPLTGLAVVFLSIYLYNPIAELESEEATRLAEMQALYDSLNTSYINPHLLEFKLFELAKSGTEIHPLIFLMLERMQESSKYAAKYPLVASQQKEVEAPRPEDTTPDTKSAEPSEA